MNGANTARKASRTIQIIPSRAPARLTVSFITSAIHGRGVDDSGTAGSGSGRGWAKTAEDILRIPDARVGQRVTNVGQQQADDGDDRHDERHREDNLLLAGVDGVDHEAAHALEGK